MNHIINKDGTEYWYNEQGQYHKEDGPAIKYVDGGKEWWLNGELHREDGPAKEYINGDKYWYYYGKKHRVDGPAIEFLGGHESWYYHGGRIHCKNNEEFLKIIKLRMFW